MKTKQGPAVAKSKWMSRLRVLAKLGRLKMTVFSAVTYAAGASLAPGGAFDGVLFLYGWLFVFLTQLVAHFFGEYFDFPSDVLNIYAGPLTGGSKVLASGDVTPKQCFRLGCACIAAASAVLVGLLPRRCWTIGCALLFIAHQYSAPPFKFNYRGLGELSASIATNALLPLFAAMTQSPSVEAAVSSFATHESLAVLVVPAFFLKFALFVALNMADRRPDWLGSKYTLPVLLGEEASARLFGVCTVLAYVSAIIIYVLGLCPATTLVGILMTAPEGLSIAMAFNPCLTTRGPWACKRAAEPAAKHEQTRRPYRLESLVIRVLKHAPGVVVAVLLDIVLREIVAAGYSTTAKLEGSRSGLWTTGVITWCKELISVLSSTSLPIRCLPVVPFVFLFFVRKRPPPPPSASAAAATATAAQDAQILISGGGVGGLVLGACLQRLGLPFQILEKSDNAKYDGGADLALWPAATKILKELGVGSGAPSEGGGVRNANFWQHKTYPVQRVRICKVDKTPPACEHPWARSEHSNEGLEAPPQDDTLTTVNMDAVVDGEGEPFRLVGRQAVMEALLPLVEERYVRRGVRVARVKQSYPPAKPMAKVYAVDDGKDGGGVADSARDGIACRVLVGADGIHSVCRSEVSTGATVTPAVIQGATENADRAASASAAAAVPTPEDTVRSAEPRDGGEVCYRGVLDLRPGSDLAVKALREIFEADERKHPSSMSVVYGDRIRFSWGFLDGARDFGYWFVKQLKDKRRGGSDDQVREDRAQGPSTPVGEEWPEPLRTLARMTSEKCKYAHRIQDREPLERWSTGNITLLGDACHPATPNNGQGSCMAIEDALVLATLLAENWEQPDGHVEAFYQYERARSAHTRRVQGESLKQMKLGQLTSPVAIWLRELAIRSIPPSVLQKKLRAANVFDIDGWLHRFRALTCARTQSTPGKVGGS